MKLSMGSMGTLKSLLDYYYKCNVDHICDQKSAQKNLLVEMMNGDNGDCVAGGEIAPLYRANSCDQPIGGCHIPVRYHTPNNGC